MSVTVKSCRKTGETNEYKGKTYVEFEFELSDGIKGFTGVNKDFLDKFYEGVVVDSCEHKFDRKDGSGGQYMLKTSEPTGGGQGSGASSPGGGTTDLKKAALNCATALANENKLDFPKEKFTETYDFFVQILSK